MAGGAERDLIVFGKMCLLDGVDNFLSSFVDGLLENFIAWLVKNLGCWYSIILASGEIDLYMFKEEQYLISLISKDSPGNQPPNLPLSSKLKYPLACIRCHRWNCSQKSQSWCD